MDNRVSHHFLGKKSVLKTMNETETCVAFSEASRSDTIERNLTCRQKTVGNQNNPKQTKAKSTSPFHTHWYAYAYTGIYSKSTFISLINGLHINDYMYMIYRLTDWKIYLNTFRSTFQYFRWHRQTQMWGCGLRRNVNADLTATVGLRLCVKKTARMSFL